MMGFSCEFVKCVRGKHDEIAFKINLSSPLADVWRGATSLSLSRHTDTQPLHMNKARSKAGGLGQSRLSLLFTTLDGIKQGSVSLNVVASPNPLTSSPPRQESFSLLVGL